MTSPISSDALAEAYDTALALEKAGKREAAIVAWRKVLEIDPADHGGAIIRLAALGAEPAPARMPDAYVTTLFDQHAEAFDDILVEQLGYAVPVMLANALEQHAPGPYGRGLDLGCGTGLAGSVLADRVEVMVGLDLSEGMVSLADDRGCYDELYVAEAEDFLENIGEEEAPFDLIVATDVLPYIGETSRLFNGMAAMSNPGAVLGFSTETFAGDGGGDGYRVLASHRFAHDPGSLEAGLQLAGFEVIHRSEIIVRMEKDQPAPGHLFLARKG